MAVIGISARINFSIGVRHSSLHNYLLMKVCGNCMYMKVRVNYVFMKVRVLYGTITSVQFLSRGV